MIVYMAKRIGVGLAYVGVITGFFFLRNVDYRLFGILIYAFSLIGTLRDGARPSTARTTRRRRRRSLRCT